MPISLDKKIGLALLSSGAPAILLSVFYESTVLALVGLTLVFWGCLFLLILPAKYVETEIVDYIGSSTLSAIDQIISDLNLRGKPVYIPVPRGLYLPYQIGRKSEFLYIPNENVKTETALEQAFMKNPKGLRLTPPGLALADFMEKKSKLNFGDLDLASVVEVLPSLITQEIRIADALKTSLEGGSVHIAVVKAACEDLCRTASKMKNICPYIGCPLSSSIACILTRVTSKPVTIERCQLRNNTIEAQYEIVE